MANYFVSSGESSNGIAVGSKAQLYVYEGGVATSAVIKDSGCAEVYSGGLADATTVNKYGEFVLSGGTATNTVVNYYGEFTVISGGSTIDTVINSSGYMWIGEKGFAKNITLSAGGELVVVDAIVENLTWTPFSGDLNLFYEGQVTFANKCSGVYYGNGTEVFSHAQVLESKTLAFTDMFVMSGGTANSTTIEYGQLEIYSGGLALNTSANYSFVVRSGGTASKTILDNKYGKMEVQRGGKAGNTKVEYYGTIIVRSGGTATEISAGNNAVLNFAVAPNTYIQGKVKGSSFEEKNAVLSGFMIEHACTVTVFSGGIVKDITASGYDEILETNYGRGILDVSSGGTAASTLVENGGSMNVFYGAFADSTTISSGGSMVCYSGAIANSTTVAGGRAFFNSGTTATNNYISGGSLWIGRDVDIHDLVVDCGGKLMIGSCASAGNVVAVDGTVELTTSSVVSNLAIGSGCSLIVNSASELTGHISFDSDMNFASAFKNAIINFDLTQTQAGQSALVENLSILDGTPLYTLTVFGSQKPGKYILANGVDSFNNRIITVQNRTGKELGSFSIGKSATIGGSSYVLTLVDRVLTVSITGTVLDNTAPTVSHVKADIMSPTNQNVKVTADFQDETELAFSLYRIGENGVWKDYTDGVILTQNATVFFKAVDDSGNESEIVSLAVDNIDKIAPETPKVSASTTAETNKPVTVTATFSKDSAMKEYSLDGETWTAYTAAVKFTENGSVYFRGIDSAGNVSEIAYYAVENIKQKQSDQPGDHPEEQPADPSEVSPDNGWNNILYDKKTGLSSQEANFVKNPLTSGTTTVLLDKKDSVSKEISGVTYNNFVGKNDETDFAKISLAHGAKLKFDIEAADAAKFTIYSLTEGTGKKTGTYTMKALQTTTLKKAGSTTTKEIMLGPGDYYVSMQSTNAKTKKGGKAFYNVKMNEECVFYEKGDNSDDWTDLAKNGASGQVDVILESLDSDTTTLYEGWVGFGDSIDYTRVYVNWDTSLTLNFTATDKAKFTIWGLTWNQKKRVYALKKVASVSVNANKTSQLKSKLLESGYYYLSVESTNAKKGGDAYYSVTVDSENSIFFDGADSSNNMLYDKKAKEFAYEDDLICTELSGGTRSVYLDIYNPVLDAGSYENFVGYQDPIDYAKIELKNPGKLNFSITATGNATFTVYKKNVNKKGNETLDVLQTTKIKLDKKSSVAEVTTAALSNLEAGDYYISMTAKSTTSNAKGNVRYNVRASLDPYLADALAMPETSSADVSNTSLDRLLAQSDLAALDAISSNTIYEGSAGALASL